MGKGKRSDFTQDNVDDKGDFVYDYDRMKTLSYSVEKIREKAMKMQDTTF
jgi:hypothetical protein